MIIGWDLSSRLCGWCAGDGSTMPVAGAFELVRREHLGKVGAEFQGHVLRIHKRFPAAGWAVEKPLLLPTDALWSLERIYGVAFLLWTLAEKLGVECKGVSVEQVKSEWGGARRASKDDMVFVCEKVGIVLPATIDEGRRDAADACGAWKVGLRLFRSPYLARWDSAIYGRKALL